MSYSTVAEANTYFQTRLYSQAWDEATTANKTIALAEATERIDRLRFAGWPVDDDQANEFPRYFDWSEGADGTEEVPDDIKKAEAEIAMALLDGIDPDQEAEDLRVGSSGYSSVRMARNTRDAVPHVAAGIPSMTAWRYLLPWLSPDRKIVINRV